MKPFTFDLVTKRLALIAIVGAAVTSHAAVLDNFTLAPMAAYVASPGNFDDEYGYDPGLFGGVRNIFLSYDAGGNSPAQATAGAGSFEMATPPGGSVNVLLAYGNLTLDPGYSGSTTTDDNLRLNFVSNEHKMNVYAQMIAVDGSFEKFYARDIEASDSPFSLEFTAADLVDNSAPSGAQFGLIVIGFAAGPVYGSYPTGNDFALSSIETVPEPTSMVVLGLGLATALRKRRA